MTPIHYVGKVWCVKVPTGAFVARRNGKVFVTGNSGFPKGQDIGKQIDKAAGAEREVVGIDQERLRRKPNPQTNNVAFGKIEGGEAAAAITRPATDEAEQWDGWNTTLKPAVESWWLLRKPLTRATVAENVKAYGTGALNIDACRIPIAADDPIRDAVWTSQASSIREGTAGFVTSNKAGDKLPAMSNEAGRHPAHLIVDGSPEVLAVFPQTTSGARATRGDEFSSTVYSAGRVGGLCESDSGSAARFFYCPKARKDERRGSKHPTVKPLALMEWLIKLITPPGATVLDPFMGSGTTIEAAYRGGWTGIGIEQCPDYWPDSEARLKAAEAGEP